MDLKLSAIRIDGGTQPRESIDEGVVAKYAAIIDELPPIVTFFDGTKDEEGQTDWIADGFHRYHAHAKAGRETIKAERKKGTKRDAILYSVGANAAHGNPRTPDDERRAVNILLRDKEWNRWSDYEIAKQCKVSHDLVQRLRKKIVSNAPAIDADTRRKAIRNGREYEINTANIGKGRKPEKPDAAPRAKGESVDPEDAPVATKPEPRNPSPYFPPPTPEEDKAHREDIASRVSQLDFLWEQLSWASRESLIHRLKMFIQRHEGELEYGKAS